MKMEAQIPNSKNRWWPMLDFAYDLYITDFLAFFRWEIFYIAALISVYYLYYNEYDDDIYDEYEDG